MTMGRPARIGSLLLSLVLPSGLLAQVDDEIARQAFIQAFGAPPAGSLSKSNMVAGGSPTAVAAIEAGRRAVAAPADNRLQAELTDRLSTLIESEGGENILATLFLVVKESVFEMSEEKKYWLDRLSEQNAMSERLSEYMKELSEAGQELGRIEQAGRVSTVATVLVTVRTFDPVWLDTLGEPPGVRPATVCDPCLATRETTLNAEQIQREQEAVLGILRRLETAMEATRTGQAGIERRSGQAVDMLAEVLKDVVEGRDDRIGRPSNATS